MEETVKLVYQGPLKQCGFTGPQSQVTYIARRSEPFEVYGEDADGLLHAHSKVLIKHQPKSARKSKAVPAEPPAKDDPKGDPGDTPADKG
jgi:hypothetical protein